MELAALSPCFCHNLLCVLAVMNLEFSNPIFAPNNILPVGRSTSNCNAAGRNRKPGFLSRFPCSTALHWYGIYLCIIALFALPLFWLVLNRPLTICGFSLLWRRCSWVSPYWRRAGSRFNDLDEPLRSATLFASPRNSSESVRRPSEEFYRVWIITGVLL